jgi:hypothetical protein
MGEEKKRTVADIVNSFDSWINYIQGFIKGIEACKDVKIDVFNTCITEILEGMQQNKTAILFILNKCNEIALTHHQSLEEITLLKEEIRNLNEDNTKLLELQERKTNNE